MYLSQVFEKILEYYVLENRDSCKSLLFTRHYKQYLYQKSRIYISIHLLMLFGKITTRYVLEKIEIHIKLYYSQDIINSNFISFFFTAKILHLSTILHIKCLHTIFLTLNILCLNLSILKKL